MTALASVRMPALYSQLLEEEILENVKRGQRPETAARAAGVPIPQWREWKARAGRGEQPFHRLFELVLSAEASARGAAQVKVFSEHPARWLEAQPASEADESSYARESRVKVESTSVSVALTGSMADLRQLSDEQLRRLAAAPEPEVIEVDSAPVKP